ncbi:hypothetical protein GEV29_09835 [Aeromicrobium sp. SMF47]|uniref:hypothetical protein n=1 Tax=Aeromicrobium yanjiei TaxID=2662028 RepID=UPI00129D7493|nr:hypothetical protein [Aeromicrobium yanjiei]MRJ76836.1 hypothetical protein [Aeromicrobium yanjiei]
MTARPVPLTVDPSVMYAVVTASPLESEDLIPPPSPELLRRYGTSEPALERLSSRRHQLLLMRSCRVEDAAATQRDVRVEALRLAEEHDGVVIDLAIPRVVEERADEVSLAHATQWYVADYAHLDAGELRTVGLASFGLPEIHLSGVSRQQHAMFSAVLAGLVHRLIAEWPANDPVGDATVTLRDIAYGLGDPSAAETPKDRAVGVRIDYDPDENVLLVRVLDDPATALFAP